MKLNHKNTISYVNTYSKKKPTNCSSPTFAHHKKKKMNLFTKKNLFLAGLVSLHFTAFSQETDLNPVTVTANLTPIKAAETGRNITVIKGDQLAKQPIYSIDDLLKYLPGVEVQQRGPMGAQADIVIRGGTFQQVLVVLDGIRLNDPLTGHFSSYIPIAVTEIDRVEVLYGAASAIYGTEAVGGVINVVTKTFQNNKNITKQLQAQFTGGEYGLFNMNLGGIYKKGKHTIGGGISSNNANGQPQRGTNGYVHNTTGSLSYATALGKNINLAARIAYDDRDFAAQNFYTSFKSDTAFEQVKTWWNHLQLQYEKGNSKLSFNAGYKKVNDYYKFNSVAAANDNDANLLQGQLVYSKKLKGNDVFTTGVQYINKHIASNDRGNHTVTQVGVFAMLQKQFGKHIFTNTALRYDNSDAFNSKLTAQLNTSYKLKNAQLRFSIGNTIRDADFTERYNNYGKLLVSSGSIGNPNLTAEQSLSYEIGADYWVKNNWKFTASWFKREQSDLIDFVTTPYANMPRKDNLSPTGVYALALNISKVNTAGLELSAQYQKNWGKHSLMVMVGSTWMQSRSADTSSKTSFYINSHATFLLNYNVQYSYKSWSIAANGLYKQRGEMTATAINATISNNYFVANVKLGYEFLKKQCQAFVQVNNFYDKSYSDLLGSVMPKRWISGGLHFKL